MSGTNRRPGPPGPANDWALEHVDRLLDSYQRLTGRALHTGPEIGAARARAVFEADFALLSHGLESDPLFNYGNRTAMALFELDWDRFVGTPSRESAETDQQSKREVFMQTVRRQGFVDDYSGVRVSATGRRFVIEQATVWNVIDADGTLHGQAATFPRWRSL